LDEARSYAPKDKDCVITKISIYNPDSPIFEYESRNSEGQCIKDIMEASSETEAKATIKTMVEGMGYTITKFSVWKNTD